MVMRKADVPLFRRFGEALPIAWRPILDGPTPVRRLESLERRLGGGPIWLKDDGLTSSLYGGNKPRKLEFLLAHAQSLGAARVMTVGGVGSNHCLATTIHGRRAGLNVSLLLFPQHVTESVRRSLLSYQRYGADLIFVPSYDAMEAYRLEAESQWLAEEGAVPSFIPAGGSSPLGALGMVSAGLELAEQVRAGDLPEPRHIYLAAGTCGTLAGIALGCRLGGLKTQVIGVRVTPDFVASESITADLVNGCLSLLTDAGADVDPAPWRPEAVLMEPRFFGEGYGYPIAAGEEAVAAMRDCEGIALENTYTGKALAALCEAVRSNPGDGPCLFWNTYNAVDTWSAVKDAITATSLPQAFHSFFTAHPSNLE